MFIKLKDSATSTPIRDIVISARISQLIRKSTSHPKIHIKQRENNMIRHINPRTEERSFLETAKNPSWPIPEPIQNPLLIRWMVYTRKR